MIIELFHVSSNRKFSFEVVEDFPKKFGLFKASVPRFYLKPLDVVAESIPLKLISVAVSHRNCFVNKSNDLKIWNIDFNIEKSDLWEPVLTAAQEKQFGGFAKSLEVVHGPAKPQRNQVEFASVKESFLENYEKLLTCFLASKIENQRAKYAHKKRTERRQMTQRLFEMEVGSSGQSETNKENVDTLQTIDETNNQGQSRQVRRSLILEKKLSKIGKNKPSFGFGPKMEDQEKLFRERKRQLKKEIDELFEVEGRTLWNYSMSVKIQEGLLVELENLVQTTKNEYGSYSPSHARYLETVEDLKQTIEVVD